MVIVACSVRLTRAPASGPLGSRGAAVGVEDRVRPQVPVGGGYSQGGRDQAGPMCGASCQPNDHPGVFIDHGGQVELPFPRYAGDVANEAGAGFGGVKSRSIRSGTGWGCSAVTVVRL